MLPSSLVIILRRSFCSWKKPDCVPDLSGHWMPQLSPWKCFKTESLLNQLKQTQSMVPSKFCMYFSVLHLSSARFILSGTGSAGVQFVMGNVFWGGDATPGLSFALTKALLSVFCITLSRSTVTVALECSSWKGNRVQAGKGRWSLLWVRTQVPTQTSSVCPPAAVLAAETGMTEAPRKAGMGGYDPCDCVQMADCGLEQFLVFTKVSAAPSPAVRKCNPLVFAGFQ